MFEAVKSGPRNGAFKAAALAALLLFPLATQEASASEWGCMFAKKTGNPGLRLRYCEAASTLASRFLPPAASAGNALSSARADAGPRETQNTAGTFVPCTAQRGS